MGPYDSEVLNDLDYAATLEAVAVTTVHYARTYGFDIRTGKKAHLVQQRATEALKRFDGDIDWVMAEFGGRTAAELELASTIVYADRESPSRYDLKTLARHVHEVKPHFSEETIVGEARRLLQKGLLINHPRESAR